MSVCKTVKAVLLGVWAQPPGGGLPDGPKLSPHYNDLDLRYAVRGEMSADDLGRVHVVDRLFMVKAPVEPLVLKKWY